MIGILYNTNRTGHNHNDQNNKNNNTNNSTSKSDYWQNLRKMILKCASEQSSIVFRCIGCYEMGLFWKLVLL